MCFPDAPSRSPSAPAPPPPRALSEGMRDDGERGHALSQTEGQEHKRMKFLDTALPAPPHNESHLTLRDRYWHKNRKCAHTKLHKGPMLSQMHSDKYTLGDLHRG